MRQSARPPKGSDLRAAALGEKLDGLTDHIYNGNLDDQKGLRAALGDVVEEALNLGYDIGRVPRRGDP